MNRPSSQVFPWFACSKLSHGPHGAGLLLLVAQGSRWLCGGSSFAACVEVSVPGSRIAAVLGGMSLGKSLVLWGIGDWVGWKMWNECFFWRILNHGKNNMFGWRCFKDKKWHVCQQDGTMSLWLPPKKGDSPSLSPSHCPEPGNIRKSSWSSAVWKPYFARVQMVPVFAKLGCGCGT